jgi:hypothetical protein
LLELVAALADVVVLIERVINVDLWLREERKRLIDIRHRVKVPDFATFIAWERA